MSGEKSSGFNAYYKFYPRVEPLITKFFNENYRCMTAELREGFRGLLDQVLWKVARMYQRDLLKDKYGVDIEVPDPLAQGASHDGAAYAFVSPGGKRLQPCEICGEVRATHLCHVIPRDDGGPDIQGNFVALCANHHHLFDRHQLSAGEWARLEWAGKPNEVQEYVTKVRLPRQEAFWKFGGSTVIGCECGGTDFAAVSEEYFETNFAPWRLVRVLTCTTCGREFYAETLYAWDVGWWWQLLSEKARRGEMITSASSKER